MRKLILALAVVLVLIVTGIVVIWSFEQSERNEAAAVLGADTPEALAARYPEVATSNGSAERLRDLARPLEIDFTLARKSMPAKVEPTNPAVTAAGVWLDEQRELADDSITSVPPVLEAWLDAHDADLTAIAQHLASSEAPRWPITAGPKHTVGTIPNLLAHMRMMKVFSAASLRAEARGDHARAWEMQQATWHLARSLYDRPELISRLVAIAGFRLIAATGRKLEPPAPAWLAELDALRVREEMLDSSAYEFSTLGAVERPRKFPVDLTLTEWVAADLLGATAGELRRLANADPCKLDLENSRTRIRANLSPLARRMDFGTPSLVSAMARAAEAEIAIDGTVRVMEMKAALANGAAPAASTPSPCKGAEWVYGPRADGTTSLRFTGKVIVPERTVLSPIPTEYVVR